MVLNRSNLNSVNVVVWLLLRPEKEISDLAFEFSQSLTTDKRDTSHSFALKSQNKKIYFLIFLRSFCWLPFNLENNLTREHKVTITLP
jgi:hypothetical protein